MTEVATNHEPTGHLVLPSDDHMHVYIYIYIYICMQFIIIVYGSTSIYYILFYNHTDHPTFGSAFGAHSTFFSLKCSIFNVFSHRIDPVRLFPHNPLINFTPGPYFFVPIDACVLPGLSSFCFILRLPFTMLPSKVFL